MDYRIGGTAGDQGYGVAATSDGGFVVAGWSASKAGYVTSSPDRTNYTTPTQLWEAQDGTNDGIPNRIAPSGSDSVVVKFDKDGNVEYTALHNYGVMEQAYNTTSPTERLTDVTVDEQDNIYLVGYDAVAKGVQNGVVAKLKASDGSLVWHRSAGRANDKMKELPADEVEKIKAEYNGVAVLKDGSVVVSGEADQDAESEEGWKVIGANDALWVHYSESGDVLDAQCVGTISYRTTDDIGSKHASVTAAPDGGFIFAGTQFGVMQEDEMISRGYDWGNYGAQDGVLMKYSAKNALEWADNVGTRQGDWINSVLVRDDGELIVVGESNGRNGYPAWGNNGGIDGVVMCTTLYPDAFTEAVNTFSDGEVTWADGTYTATGDGHGGKDAVRVTTKVEEGKIASVKSESLKETESYYSKAAVLCGTIVEKQSTQVDVITRATMSSQGILEATEKTLGQAAAAHVDALIAAIETAEDKTAATQAAAAAYGELGTYSASQLKKLDALQSAAQTYAVTLTSREDKYEGSKETKPEKSKKLKHNDAYYKLQNKYLSLINAEALEKKGLDGEGITIAVIDSGVTPAHQDLDYSRILDGYDYDNDKEMKADMLVDSEGHGTAVAGILAAKADNGMGVAGLLSKVKVVPLKVTPSKKLDDNSSKLVAKAITEAVDKYHADVITTSLEVKDTEELSAAVKHAAEQNVLITGAAGNSSKEASNGSDPYVYPASYDEVVSVGAVYLNKKVRSTSQKNDKVFVTAPGERIAVLDLSRNLRCKLADGTSYASPIVAAMAAAAKQYDKTITPERFKTLLQTTSKDAGVEGFDNSYGYGIVDCSAFVRALYNITTEYAIELDKSELSLTQGETAVLSATVTPEEAENRSVVWSSEDESIVTVDENGTVSAVAPGTAVVTAECAGDNTVSAQCSVTVKEAPAQETLPDEGTPADGTWSGIGDCQGFGYSVTLKAVFQDGRLVELKDFALVNNDDEDNEDFADQAWQAMKTRIVEAKGGSVDTVSGATHSSEAILSAYKDAYGQAVKAAESVVKPTKVTLSKKELTIKVGETSALSAEVEPENASNKALSWSSSDESVATVDDKGTVSAKAEGSATITVTSAADKSLKDTCTVTVEKETGETKPEAKTEEKAQSITAKNVTKTLGDKSFSLGARAKTTLSYKSSNTKVADVDKKGKVTIKGVGEAKITITAKATDAYKSATKDVTVTVNPKGAALSKVKAGKKQFTASWKKNTAVNGYQLQYSTDKAFKKGVKTVKISKNKTVSTTVKKLSAKKKYFVRVRTFKKVGKKTYNSSWSKVKKVSVK